MEAVLIKPPVLHACALSPPLRYSFCSQTGQTTAELGRAGLSSASRRLVRPALVSVRPSLPGRAASTSLSPWTSLENIWVIHPLSRPVQARPTLLIITKAGRYSGHGALGAVCILAKHVFKSHFDVLQRVLVDTFRTFSLISPLLEYLFTFIFMRRLSLRVSLSGCLWNVFLALQLFMNFYDAFWDLMNWEPVIT